MENKDFKKYLISENTEDDLVDKDFFATACPNPTEFEDDFFDVKCTAEEFPHLLEWRLDPKLSEKEKTVIGMEYIFQEQGYCPSDIVFSYEEKEQTFNISFKGAELFGTGRVASLIKAICHRSEKHQTKMVCGIEALEFTITLKELNHIVFDPSIYVCSDVLIKEVLRALDSLHLEEFYELHEDSATVRFVIEGPVLMMELADSGGKTIEGIEVYDQIISLREKFLILSPEDQEMAEYLMSLNCNLSDDRLITHINYIIEVEGQRKFGCYEDDFVQKFRERKYEGVLWVETRIRNRKIDALLDIQI
ncbi:hypothetical protein [Sabulibacter ruber]|uniref:hypothetical protein n=1 Tax=Sabulibacter ruber TaxID=2811901 RepID=UPI001A95B6DC|nr:hypothetical protein [Sabulibacter ruber]